MRLASSIALVLLASCRRVDGTGPAPSTSPGTPPASSAGLAPATSTSSAPAAGATRVLALAWETPVREAPRRTARTLGYLRAGGFVPAKAESAGKSGCKDWREIEPRGFVCVDGVEATLDEAHPFAKLLAIRPDRGAAMPYLYGMVRRAGPIYARLPSRAEAARAEPDLTARMTEWLALDDENGARFRSDLWLRGRVAKSPAELWDTGADDGLGPFGGDRPWPGNLSGLAGKGALVVGTAKRRTGFGILDTAALGGRRYAITTHLLAVPVDRLRPIEGSSFHGYKIPEDVDFPFAIIRRDGAHAYAERGKALERTRDLPRRSALRLTGKQRLWGKSLYYQLADGDWVSDAFASRLDPAKKMPKWGKQGERWLDVNVTKQTLVAYDGVRAVYATLVSTGEAGLGDPATSKATKRGIFRVHTKHVASTMDSDVVGEEFELRDIPWVQYFEGGYALHAAYWHDDFGTPRSHGCINLAPLDAKWLFDFTSPAVPPDWHGAQTALTGSVVFVHP